MACVFDPKTNPSGEVLKWDPPHTKPFVHFVTSASEPLTTQNNVNFVKTKSLIYSAFHPTARYINFDVGYSKDAKWLDSLNDKWSDYANFFVGGFLEAIYSINEKGLNTVYIQIDAKFIDYDIRFRTSTSNFQSVTPSPKPSTNAFAARRAKQSSDSLTTPKPAIPTVTTQEADDNYNTTSTDYDKESQGSQRNFSSTKSTPTTPTPITPAPISPTLRTKRQLSDFCNDDDEPTNDEPTDEPADEPKSNNKKGKGEKGRGGGRGGRGGRGKGKK